jgi:regulator of replication initiation timing
LAETNQREAMRDDITTLEAAKTEIAALERKVESLETNLTNYMHISEHWGNENSSLRKRLHEIEQTA